MFNFFQLWLSPRRSLLLFVDQSGFSQRVEILVLHLFRHEISSAARLGGQCVLLRLVVLKIFLSNATEYLNFNSLEISKIWILQQGVSYATFKLSTSSTGCFLSARLVANLITYFILPLTPSRNKRVEIDLYHCIRNRAKANESLHLIFELD